MRKFVLIVFLSFVYFIASSQVHDWQNVVTSNSSYNDISILKVKTDKFKNVYTIGGFKDSMISKNNSNQIVDVQNADSARIYIQKYDSTGDLKWTKSIGDFVGG